MSTGSGPDAATRAEARRQLREAWLMVLGLGIAIIAVGNLTGVGPWWPALLVSAAMGGFGYVIRDTEVTGDTKGDAIYYLGLLFTFAALVAALATFDWETSGTTSGAIRNFGIALLTTIVGLVGRVWFAMSRETPGDVAETVRYQLDEAVFAMKGSLDRARDDLDIMANKFRDSAGDLGATSESIADTVRKVAATSGSLESCANQVVEAADALARGMNRFDGALGGGRDALDGLRERTGELVGYFHAVAEQLGAVIATFAEIDRIARPTAKGILATGDGVAASAREASTLAASLAGLRGSAAKANSALAGVADSVGSHDVVPLLREAAERMRRGSRGIESIGREADGIDGALRELGSSARGACDGLASVTGTARRIGEQLGGVGPELSAGMGPVKERVGELHDGLGGVMEQSAEVSSALDGLRRQTRDLSDEVREVHRAVAAFAPPERAVVRIRKAATRVIRLARARLPAVRRKP